MKGKLHERYSVESLERGEQDEAGKIFASASGLVDMTGVNIIGESVDTIKQLVRGRLRTDFIERLEGMRESGDEVITAPSPMGKKWHVGYGGKSSGYQYKLQNNDEGIILLIKSFYCGGSDKGSHLKIELSPKFIASRGVKEIQDQIDLAARGCLEEWEMNGCAVHLAVDVQGWTPGADFVERFVTRSRARQEYSAINEVEFKSLSNVVVMYGDKQSFLFGKAGSLQMAVYRKDLEIKVSDKEDHFYREWNNYGSWDKDKPVWRVEARFHHGVTRELGNSQEMRYESWREVAEYLADLWRYALKGNRLDLGNGYIDPAWQLLLEDPIYYHPPVGFFFKRVKKKSHGNTVKNYGQIIGNLVSVCARHGMKTTDVMRQLKGLDLYDDLLSAYRSAGKTEGDIRQGVEKGLALRRLIGRAA